jgi:hypothetical protein
VVDATACELKGKGIANQRDKHLFFGVRKSPRPKKRHRPIFITWPSQQPGFIGAVGNLGRWLQNWEIAWLVIFRDKRVLRSFCCEHFERKKKRERDKGETV